MSRIFDDFALFAEKLRQWEQELRESLLAEVRAGAWLDQKHSVLGRNRHVAACQRLIRSQSADAYYDSSTGQWWLRGSAVDAEIQRLNRRTAAKLEALPRATVQAETAVPSAAGEDEAPDDCDAAVYKRTLARLRARR